MSLQEEQGLNDFHKERNKIVSKEVKKMSKNPLTLKEKIEQVERIKAQVQKRIYKDKL